MSVTDPIPIDTIEMEAKENSERILKLINDCMLPKLAKNYDEREFHAEFDTRNNNLTNKIHTLIEELKKYDFKTSLDNETTEPNKEKTIDIVSFLINLHKELICNCTWNSDNSRECAKKLDNCFSDKCKRRLKDIFKKNDLCDNQAVFNKTLDELCKKLTPDDYKKYPGQIEIYCDLVQNCKDFDVTLNPLKLLPVSLILMDDYIELNKTKGLLCCQVLLKNLTAKDFENGNYYDVIYLSVKNALTNNNIKITELSQACALELCQIFPSDTKDEKLDEMYSDALEHLNTESNLYRKAAFFTYTRKIMQMLEIKCVGKSVFKSVICDTIENCLTDSVAEILLIPALECLEEWIKYCWPVWKLPVDFKVLCALLKYYSKCNTGEGFLYVQKLIVTLISLCTPEEQRQFTAQLGGKRENVSPKIDGLKKNISVNTIMDSTVDSHIDSTVDSNMDSTVDSNMDCTVDSNMDPNLDSPIDPNMDSTMDPSMDLTMDPNMDSTVDPEMDSTVDPEMDSTVDPEMDSTVDPEMDSTVDPEMNSTVRPKLDSRVDSNMDPTMDSTVDSNVDSNMVPTVDSNMDSTVDSNTDSSVDSNTDSNTD